MSNINPLTNDQMLLKKISRNFGNDQDDVDVSDINPLTIDQIFLKEIALSSEGAGDVPELKETVEALSDTMAANGAHNLAYSETSGTVIANLKSGVSYIMSFTGGGTVDLTKDTASGAAIETGASSPITITPDSDCGLYMVATGTVQNVIVKLATDPSTEYTPYAMTNRELTENVNTLNIGLGSIKREDWLIKTGNSTSQIIGVNNGTIIRALTDPNNIYTYTQLSLDSTGVYVDRYVNDVSVSHIALATF